MTANDAAKRAAARAALDFLSPEGGLAVGTGSTVACFVEELGSNDLRPEQAVSTSTSTDQLLRGIGVSVVPLEKLVSVPEVYVDGADEIDSRGRAIKGGGGAHTREKRVAVASKTWVCIVDDSKVVEHLGERAPVPLELERDRLSEVSRAIAGLGARLAFRNDQPADVRGLIADVTGLDLSDPARIETVLESIPGVVACGIFAHRTADIVIVGHNDGSVTIEEHTS